MKPAARAHPRRAVMGRLLPHLRIRVRGGQGECGHPPPHPFIWGLLSPTLWALQCPFCPSFSVRACALGPVPEGCCPVSLDGRTLRFQRVRKAPRLQRGSQGSRSSAAQAPLPVGCVEVGSGREGSQALPSEALAATDWLSGDLGASKNWGCRNLCRTERVGPAPPPGADTRALGAGSS